MISFGPIVKAPVIDPAPPIPIALHADIPSVIKSTLREGDVFIDVGAKNGVGSALVGAQAVGREGRVLALEPDPTKFARLLHNVALNRVANTMCFPVAASDETIYATLFCEFPRGNVSPPGHNIRVQRVDTLCTKLGCENVRLVKIDAPGSELLVLRGMSRLFQTALPPSVLCLAGKWSPKAVDDGRDALVNFMLDFGYVPKQLGPVLVTQSPGAAPQARLTLWFSKPATYGKSNSL